MGKLIKMDFYRLVQSKMFWILSGVLFLVMAIFSFSSPFLSEFLKGISPDPGSFPDNYDERFTSIVSAPTKGLTGWLMIFIFISAASFLYADMKNGYIKNIAGQLPKRSYTAVSKFIVIIFHNFVFLAAGALGKLFGILVCPKAGIIFDAFSPFGIVIFFVKLLLSVGMISIILFLTTGLRNKTLAIVLGVLFSVEALGLLYMGLNALIKQLGIQNFDITEYTLDSLYSRQYDISALSSTDAQLLLNSVCVSVGCIAVFLLLTVLLINKRDVK